MFSLETIDRSGFEKASVDLPFFANDDDRPFPFRHVQLWADASPTELTAFAEQFNGLVEQLERSRLAEVRNGLDHYRERDKFPPVEVIIECITRIAAVLDTADLKRFIPKAYWLIESRKDDFGITTHTLQDYAGRRLTLVGPAVVSGLPSRNFARAWIVASGNLLGYSNSELIFRLTEESEHTRLWANYPRRRTASAPAELRAVAEQSETVVHSLATQSADVS